VCSSDLVYFQPDNRHVVIAESCTQMAEAEQKVDAFLEEISAMDEGGATYRRISVSGEEQEGKYIFKVSVTG